MGYPYMIQGSNITVVIDNVPHTVSRGQLAYDKIYEAIKRGDWETVKANINPTTILLNYGNGRLTVKDGVVHWDDEPLHNALSNKIIDMLEQGFDITPFARLMENMMANPSYRSVQQLYSFLERGNLPITEDGYFLAFKKVTDDYLDCHTRTIDNSIGAVVSMPRNKVMDDPKVACGPGLHFCSKGYLSSYAGNRVVVVKINPRDVVSIPEDHNFEKARCCMYEVISELELTPDMAFKYAVQNDANHDDDDWDDDYDWDDDDDDVDDWQ